jgi:WD40 repeat protein
MSALAYGENSQCAQPVLQLADLQCNSGDFFKSCRLSPDGQTVLSTTETSCSVVLSSVPGEHLQETLYYTGQRSIETTKAVPPNKQIVVGESIYDAGWHPASQHFFVTSRDHPIHLYSKETGSLQSNYAGYDHVDELDASTCVTCNLDGTLIYAGAAKGTVRAWDTECPGRPVFESRSSRTKGLVSALAFCPDYSGAYAVGTYSNEVFVHVEGDAPAAEPALQLRGLDFAVTHLRWAPDGAKLWVGGRNHDAIVCWDMRHTRSEVGRIQRKLATHQRFTFDLDPWGDVLLTGSQDGQLLAYCTKTFDLLSSVAVPEGNAVNGVSMHAFCALAAVATGQRHFSTGKDEDEAKAERQSSVSLWRLPFRQMVAPAAAD